MMDFGLESLAAELEADNQSIIELSISNITPDKEQPRTIFDKEKLQALASSIKAQGILQPILVRLDPATTEQYIIIAGERRWRAAQLAGLSVIPAIVKEADDQQVIAAQIIENIDREGFTLFDEVKAVVRMCEIMGSAKAAGEALGKSKDWISIRSKIGKSGVLLEQFITKGGSSDVVGIYQLARLAQKDKTKAERFIRDWIAQPEERTNLRQRVANLIKEEEPAASQVKKPESVATTKKVVPAPKKNIPNKVEKVTGYTLAQGHIVLETTSGHVQIDKSLLNKILVELKV